MGNDVGDPSLWYVLTPGCLFFFVIVVAILLLLGGCAWLETAKRPPHPSHHITKSGWR